MVTVDIPCYLSQNMAPNSWRHFPTKNAKILKTKKTKKKHTIIENVEFYIAAKFGDNWKKNQEVIHSVHLLSSSVPTVNSSEKVNLLSWSSLMTTAQFFFFFNFENQKTTTKQSKVNKKETLQFLCCFNLKKKCPEDNVDKRRINQEIDILSTEWHVLISSGSCLNLPSSLYRALYR